MPADVVVIGAGMVTAVGLTAAETAASVRSATARFVETSLMDKRFEPFTLAEVPEDGLCDVVENLATAGLTAREARMLRLGTVALRECLKSLPPGEAAPGLALSLPETDTTRPLDGQRFLQCFAQQTAGALRGEHHAAAHPRRAGGGGSGAGGAAGPIQEVYSSMNGENHWAKEWGVAFIRNSSAFLPDHGMHHPADCYGDTGAACAVLMVGVAALGIKQGYRRSPALVYGSSDRAQRAAVLVTAA